MRINQLCLVFRWLAVILFAAAGSVFAQQADDTPAILALSEVGAQLQLNQQRIIGVTLRGEEIDNQSMELLRGLDRLQTLTLGDTKVTGAGLKQLQGLSLLGALTIHDTPISDRDIDELAALKSVVNFDLRGTKISGMGKQRLERLLRNAGRDVTIRLHFGGFFGVAALYGDSDERCKLTNVVAESAAAQAGLQIGDVIVKFDGQAIANFPELAEAVALTPPEQPIAVVVERGGKTMNVQVSLKRAQAPMTLQFPP